MTSRKSARKHGKSFNFYAHVMWSIYKNEFNYFEGLYISYTVDMAGHHLSLIKKFIENCELFEGLKWIGDAETKLHGIFNGREFLIMPGGMEKFKRGLHPRVIWCDDILRDPENKMNPTVILKVTSIFKKQIIPMIKKGGELHVCGTPQHEKDLFFELEKDGRFFCGDYPAYDEITKALLWEEMFSMEFFEDEQASLGILFYAEYLCKPLFSVLSYIRADELKEVVDMKGELKNFHPREKRETTKEVRGGWDLGKKAHPSHFVAYEKSDSGIWIQILSFWMDRMDYTEQLDYVVMAISNLKIDEICYDNTRGELESFAEQGKLPPQLKPVVFGLKTKNAMAAAFGEVVRRKQILLLNDPRQYRQILNCDEALQSFETQEGHGDSFWSNGLATQSFVLKKEPRIRYL